MAAAKGIVSARDSSQLVENGGHININRYWAHSLLSRMKFVMRKATTAKSKLTTSAFGEVKRCFFARPQHYSYNGGDSNRVGSKLGPDRASHCAVILLDNG